MKIPYAWIREFVDLDLPAAEAADRLINAGVEVASVTPLASELRGVVVGEVESVERELGESHGHRLFLCRVSTGSRRFTVVCGAPNTAVGLRAAFAPPGAVLPGGREIGTAKIRGVVSEGMLCSERELGLGEEHESGVLALDADAPLGRDLVGYLGLDDSVLEIEITPNRPDCLSVLGVARELSALTGAAFRPPTIHVKEGNEEASSLARVRIEAPDLCPRYAARVISEVSIGPSPARLAARLRAVGLRPISNVVDVTNYVLWELGHPLHAFDHATVADATIVVRRAQSGERLVTLDGQERALTSAMLVIADPRRAVAVAGVMGGANTEVTAATRRVLLESAYFDPGSIRRTSRDLGLKTDAAYRFERGADIEGLVEALDRAAALMAELGGGVVARGIVDAYPRPRSRPRLTLRMSRVARVLGVAPPRAEAVRILDRLGLTPTDRGESIEVTVPSFRRDIGIEDDLVEEIIRVWGYDKIPSTLPGGSIALVHQPATFAQEQQVRLALTAAGLSEAITYSLSDPAREVGGASGEGVALLNPLARDAAVLRTHPLQGLLGVVATNLRRQQPSVRVFEIAKTYRRAGQGTAESRWAVIALTGARSDAAWFAAADPVDVFDAKGGAEHALAALGVRAEPGPAGRLEGFEPDCHGTLVAGDGTIVAEFGEVAGAVRARFDIPGPVFAAVLALDAVLAVAVPAQRYESLPRFPAVSRDMAFVLGAGQRLTAHEIEVALRDAAGPLLRRLTLFDVFQFPDGRRSLAFRLTFQAEDRTLTDDEVNQIHATVARGVSERFQITLRGL